MHLFDAIIERGDTAIREGAKFVFKGKAVVTPSDEHGQCSICLQHGVISRLLGYVNNTGSFASFNRGTLEGYAAGQGLNAPTCVACAELLQAGFTDLIGNVGCAKRVQRSVGHSKDGPWVIWWCADRSAELWGLADATIGSVVKKEGFRQPTLEESEAAAKQLSAFGTSYVLFHGKLEANRSVRAFGKVDLNEVADRLLRWRKLDLRPVWMVAKQTEVPQEELYRSILMGDRISLPNLQRLRQMDNQTARALLTWTGEEDQLESVDQLTDRDKFFFLTGEAFAVADWIHYRERRPQVSLYMGQGEYAAFHPHKARELIGKNGRVPRKGGGIQVDRRIDTLLTAADACLLDTPLRATPHEADQFHRGYRKRKEELWTERLEWKKKNAENNNSEATGGVR